MPVGHLNAPLKRAELSPHCRSVAEHLLEDIAMPRKLRAIIADRLEVALVEAMARGRRLAGISMRIKKRKKT